MRKDFGFILEGETEVQILPALFRRAFADKPPPGRLGRAISASGSKIKNAQWLAGQVKKLRQGAHAKVVVVLDGEHGRTPKGVQGAVARHGQRVDHVVVFKPCFEAIFLAVPDVLESWFGVSPGGLPPATEKSELGCWPKKYLDRVSRERRGAKYKVIVDGRLIAGMLDPASVAKYVPELAQLLGLLGCPGLAGPLDELFDDD